MDHWHELQIKGRDKPQALFTIEPNVMLIRIDCELRPEFWAEIKLTKADLEAFLELMKDA